jgi:hypothetical protein
VLTKATCAPSRITNTQDVTPRAQSDALFKSEMWSFSEERERRAASRQFVSDASIAGLNNNWAKAANHDRSS